MRECTNMQKYDIIMAENIVKQAKKGNDNPKELKDILNNLRKRIGN